MALQCTPQWGQQLRHNSGECARREQQQQLSSVSTSVTMLSHWCVYTGHGTEFLQGIRCSLQLFLEAPFEADKQI